MSSPEFYQNTLAYDIAFSDRDFEAERDFLIHCLHEFGGKASDQKSFLELACGPGRHAITFAQSGWEASGLDLSADMLDYARGVAQRAGAQVDWVRSDMTDFRLQKPVALAANLMESLTHLTTNAQVVAHMRAVSRNLLPGGVFVIEMAHPDSIWRDNLPNIWQSKSTDSPLFAHEPFTVVDVLFGSADDHYDWVTQVWDVTTRLEIHQQNREPRLVQQCHPHRWYLAQELAALVELSGAFARWHFLGDLSVPPPALDMSEHSTRMVMVCVKANVSI